VLSSRTIRFSRRPRAVMLVGTAVARSYSEEEYLTAMDGSFDKGFQEGMSIFRDRQAKQQEELLELQRQTLTGVVAHHGTLVGQFGQMLPGLVMEGVRRVLAAVEIDKNMVVAIVTELLSEVHPGKGELEVSLTEDDLKLFEGTEETFRLKYPEISFVSDADLSPGDCMVRSRFGTFDGRIATKVENVEALLQ